LNSLYIGLDWSTISSIISTISPFLSSCATLAIAIFTFLQYRKVYDPNLRVHSYPPFKETLNLGSQKIIECIQIRAALVNPGGVPITLMTEKIEVVDQETSEKIEVDSRFTQPEWRPERLYVSQLPWVIEKFAIYEKTIYPKDLRISKSFLNRKMMIKIELEYEVKEGKRKTSEICLTWITENTH